MGLSDFSRRLRFSKQEYQELLLRMGAGSAAAKTDDVRKRDRFDYHVSDVPLTIQHPEGGTSRFLVFGRNISRNGISVLHGGYIHPGSECHVVLLSTAAEAMAVAGEVRHCRLVAGSCHEIGIQFHSEVDPAMLLGSAAASGQGAATADTGDNGFQKIDGAILAADDFEPDRELLHHQLHIFGLEVSGAATPGAVLDSVKRTNFDLILYGLALGGPDGIKTIQAIRAAGFASPIVVLSAETDQSLLQAARTAGATDIITKPWYLDLLVAQLQVHLSGPRREAPVFSTAAGQSGMPPLIAKFVNQIHRIADQIERTYAEEEWDTLRQHCHHVKGSGCGYGFQNITVAAIAVLSALDSKSAAEKVQVAVESLVGCCRALEAPQMVSEAA